MKKIVLALFLTFPLFSISQEVKEMHQVKLSRQADISNAWVEISSSQFKDNIREMQKILNGKSELCAVVKADAYGHGVQNMIPFLIETDVKCLAFGSNQEARIIRQSGFKGELMRVRAATYDEMKAAVTYNVEELIGNLDAAQYLNWLAAEHNKKFPIHLALNSAGMSRNGIEVTTDLGKKDIQDITELKNLKVVGIMTHFPIEEKEDVKKGLGNFKRDTHWIFANTNLKREDIKLHTANSFAAINVPEARLDMVRAGGALYGDMSPEIPQFKRVMTFKSKVAEVNDYPKGNTVGYDKTYTLTRDSKLANIPVGYSDGYRRVFSNKGHVLINGHKVPVLGKISMNTIMVDVTDFPDVKALDEVVLFGKQGEAEITQDEVEEINGALMADLYTIWGKINPKVVK